MACRHLYKYIESSATECNQDKVDPLVMRPSLLVMCRAARRPEYFIWNIFSVTVRPEYLIWNIVSVTVFVTFTVSAADFLPDLRDVRCFSC